MALCKSLLFLVLFIAYLSLSYAEEPNDQRYKLLVESIEPYEGEEDGCVEIVCRLSNGTEWLIQQPVLYQLKPLESVPIGAQLSIFSSTQPGFYGVLINQKLELNYLERNYFKQTCYAGTLLAGKEHLPTITSIERTRQNIDAESTLWTLSDGSVWLSTEPIEPSFNDFGFCQDAWQVGDHVLISTQQSQNGSEKWERWWMLNTDYDWCSSSYEKYTYKPFLWIFPLKNPSSKVLKLRYETPRSVERLLIRVPAPFTR